MITKFILFLIIGTSAGAQISFERASYSTTPDSPLSANIVYPVTSPPALFSGAYWLMIEGSNGVGYVALNPEAPISFDGPMQGDPSYVTRNGSTTGIMQTVSFFDPAKGFHTGNKLATATIAGLPEGVYTLRLKPLRALGTSTEVAFVAGDGTALDATMTFGTATLTVTRIVFDMAITNTGAVTLNRQTGLYRQQITVRNNAASESGLRLLTGNLPAGATLYNASGTTESGTPFIQVDTPVSAGALINLTLEYYVPSGAKPTPTLALEAPATNTPPVPAANAPISVDRIVPLANGLLIEFPSVIGKQYLIQYSPDMQTWTTSGVPITAGGTRVQWIDDGPPKTPSQPGIGSRFYRVIRQN